MANNVYFKHGTQAQYDALAVKDPSTLYWLGDSKRLYNGETLFGDGNAISSLTPVDGTIEVSGEGASRTIGVKVSEAAGNQLSANADGLFVQAPGEFAIERQGEAEEGFAASYKLKRTQNGVSEYVGDTINIPKDLVIERGSLETVTVDDEPYEGTRVGDMYLDIVLNDANEDHIYVPVTGLVDTYTAGDGIAINDHQISVTNRTVEVLNGPNGTARVWNESDGGGVQFTHNDGTRSFTGVNDGGKDGITGQLYSVDTKNGNLGTRLNMTNDGFYYIKGKTSATAYTAEDELATKRDITAAALVWETM